MERPTGYREKDLDPSFANRFVGQAEKMNDEFGIADKLGIIDPVHRETLTMYLGLRMLRAEVANDTGNGFSRRGLLVPAIAQVHRLRGVSRDPYRAALNSYESAYRDFVEEVYPEIDGREDVFSIQNAVTDLIGRFTAHVHMPGMRGSMDFEIWKPNKRIVKDWGMDWAGKISTQRGRGQ